MVKIDNKILDISILDIGFQMPMYPMGAGGDIADLNQGFCPTVAQADYWWK